LLKFSLLLRQRIFRKSSVDRASLVAYKETEDIQCGF
jgi:hypothetical protein